MEIVFKVFGFVLAILVINVLSDISDNLGVIAWLLGGRYDDEE